MVVGTEHLGVELCSQRLQWECEFREQLERRLNERKMSHERDRHLEDNQRLHRQIQTARKDLERLCRDNELLRNENELLRSQAKEHEESSGRTLAPTALNECSEKSLRYASFMLPRFNGTDPTEYARTWLKAIQKCQSLFGWTEAETLLAARVSLEGPARQWLTMQRRDVTTWKEFKHVFESRYGKEETSATRVHLALAQHRWMKGEDVDEYVRYMKDMAQRIGLEDNYTKEYLINGFTDDELVRVGLRKIETLDELDTALAQYDEIQFLKDMKESAMKATEKSCYNCKVTGHLFLSCSQYEENGFLRLAIIIFIIFFIMGM